MNRVEFRPIEHTSFNISFCRYFSFFLSFDSVSCTHEIKQTEHNCLTTNWQLAKTEQDNKKTNPEEESLKSFGGIQGVGEAVGGERGRGKTRGGGGGGGGGFQLPIR